MVPSSLQSGLFSWHDLVNGFVHPRLNCMKACTLLESKNALEFSAPTEIHTADLMDEFERSLNSTIELPSFLLWILKNHMDLVIQVLIGFVILLQPTFFLAEWFYIGPEATGLADPFFSTNYFPACERKKTQIDICSLWNKSKSYISNEKAGAG